MFPKPGLNSHIDILFSRISDMYHPNERFIPKLLWIQSFSKVCLANSWFQTLGIYFSTTSSTFRCQWDTVSTTNFCFQRRTQYFQASALYTALSKLAENWLKRNNALLDSRNLWKVVKSKRVERQFKCAFQKLVKHHDSIVTRDLQ